MSKHKDFITSPIIRILEDAVTASASVGCGIETYPLSDYIMQSVFLKMTGFQEQKMKCICWELATEDYEYRYDKYTKGKVGECSSYDEKNGIYKDLIKQIKLSSISNILDQNKKQELLTRTTDQINNLFSDSNLSVWIQQQFINYKEIWADVKCDHFAIEAGKHNKLLDEHNTICLKKIYEEYLYKHRNRCAHNTLSYQQNLPTLKKLEDESYKYENYFLWFSVLVLIDSIFIELYNQYLDVIECNSCS